MAEATTNGGFLLDDRIALLDDRIRDRRSDDGLRAAYQDMIVTWKSEAAAIDGQIVGYFAKTSDPNKDALVIAMRAYDRVVQNYLAYCLLPGRELKEFDRNLRIMRKQTGGEPKKAVVPGLVRSYRRGAAWSPKEVEGFKEKAQNDWAQNIVNASAPINAMIYERQPNGLEVGAGAFIRQIIPFN